MNKGKYTVNEVEERMKVPASTLRQWERRYGFPKPARSDAGYRLYSEKDLHDIDMMKRHIAEGIPASRAAELVKKLELAAPGPRSLSNLQEELIETLKQFDEIKADRIFSEAHALHTVDAVMLELMHNTMEDIETRWQNGELSVCTAHFAKSYMYGRLHALLGLTPNIHSGLPVIVACAPSEHCELSPLILSVSLRRAGYRVYYLGANASIAELHDMSRALSSIGVIIAVANEQAWHELGQHEQILSNIAPILAFCGSVFHSKTELARTLGGIGLDSDPDAAVRHFHKLVQNLPTELINSTSLATSS